MSIGIELGQFVAVLLGFIAIIGFSLHHRVWSARKVRIHKEAEAFSEHIDQGD